LRRARGREEDLASEMPISDGVPSLTLQERWVYSSAIVLNPLSVSVTGHVAAADGDRTLCCIAPDGKLVFTRRFEDRIRTFRLSRDGAYLFVSLFNNTSFLLDSAGETLWEIRHPDVISASDIRISDGAVIVGGPSQAVCVFNRDGRQVSSLALGAPIEFIQVSADESSVLVGNFNAFIGVLDDGLEALWLRRLGTLCGVGRFSSCGQWIILPAYGMGAYLFDSRGRDVRAFKPKRPVKLAACVDECKVVALGTIDGELYLLGRDGGTQVKFELSCRPTSWAIDADSRLIAIADSLGSVRCYELISGDSSRFWFLEHSHNGAETSEKRPLYVFKLFRQASCRRGAQVRVLPGGKHTLCATSEGQILSIDWKGKKSQVASLGTTIFSLQLASRSYCFAATTEDQLYAFAHDQLKWHRRIGTAMLAINALGNHFATMDVAGNIYVFDSHGELIRTWTKSSDARYFLISPSGEDMVVVEARRAVVVDFKGKAVFCVEFSPGARLGLDDQFVYVGDSRGAVTAFDLVGQRLWAANIGEPVARLRPFEDGLFCTTASEAAFMIGRDGEIAWRKTLASKSSVVARNQEREFVEVFRQQKALICLRLGGELLWKADLGGTHRSLSVDASGEFVSAFDGLSVWLFAVSDLEPSEPDRFDFLEL